MKQPELGTMVAELRLQKGLTQERLAEEAGISVRTVQRIEKGETEPEKYTMNRLSEILNFDFNRNSVFDFWLGLLHLSSSVCIVVIPLLIWIYRKEKNPLIEKHGRDVLNFQLTMTILLLSTAVILIAGPIITAFLNDSSWFNFPDYIFILISLLPVAVLIAIGIICFYQGIANTMRVLNGKDYHYPMSIPFMKD